jgi:lipoate-protein ligase B
VGDSTVSITVHHLGLVEYADGLELQRRFQEARRAGAVGDSLMLLQHPPVLTLGRGAKQHNVLASPEKLRALGVELHETDRGGDVTYHGPGQIVGYPLLYLPPGQQDVRRYVRRIEEVMIRVCAHFGIEAHREEKWPGVWTKGRKIAALGVHLSRWYTRHGFALNVQPNLQHFELIVPCGIREAGVTSMTQELGRPIFAEEVEPLVAQKFAEVFEQPLTPAPEPLRTVSVVVRQQGSRSSAGPRRAASGRSSPAASSRARRRRRPRFARRAKRRAWPSSASRRSNMNTRSHWTVRSSSASTPSWPTRRAASRRSPSTSRTNGSSLGRPSSACPSSG